MHEVEKRCAHRIFNMRGRWGGMINRCLQHMTAQTRVAEIRKVLLQQRVNAKSSTGTQKTVRGRLRDLYLGTFVKSLITLIDLLERIYSSILLFVACLLVVVRHVYATIYHTLAPLVH